MPLLVTGILLSGAVAIIVSIYRQKLYRAAKNDIERLKRMVMIDTLTELGNHRGFYEELGSTLQQAQAEKEPVGLALITIDELKRINEEQGHLNGDRLLTKFADLLRSTEYSKRAFRLGGNLFAVIHSGGSEDRFAKAMHSLSHTAGQQLLGTTISAGVTISQEGEYDAQMLRAQADAALREAKKRGNNTVIAFSEIRERTTLLHPQKVCALRQLLSEKRIDAHFQPIWDLKRGTLLSYEALVRPAADYGFRGPQEAFDIAERLGRSPELDYLCVKAILARAKELPDDVLLFMNLTPPSLSHGLLTSAVLLAEVTSAGLSPQRVVIELTERSITDLPVLIHEARQLRELGFRLALDDTGAGNAGLEMLSQLEVDFVKIDRALVTNALFDKAARGVLTGIRSIAREIGAAVIAEGIEDDIILEMVQHLEIEAAQGYLLGRPSASMLDTATMRRLCPARYRKNQDLAISA